MEQTLYYTFSTIAQVLAAMIVFYGVFFLNRMTVFRKRFSELTENFLMEIDEKDKRKEDVIQKVRPAFDGTDEWERLPYRVKSSLRQGKYRWIIKNAIGKALPMDSGNGILRDTKSGMELILVDRKWFTNYSTIAIVIGGIQLIESLLVLSLIPILLQYCDCLSYFLLLCNFLIMLLFMLFIIYTIIKTFRMEIENDDSL